MRCLEIIYVKQHCREKITPMKNLMRIFAFFLLAFLTSCAANSGTTKNEVTDSTLLWEITGNGLEKPSYLYGTFHMMCGDQFTFPAKLDRVMQNTEQTVLEINFSDMAQMAEMQKFLLADKKLSETYTAAELVRFRKGIADYGMKLEDVDQFSPMALYSMLTMKFFDCAPTEMKIADMEIMQKTIAQGKKVDGLENIAMQAETFSKYLSPTELLKMVESYEKSKDQTNHMLNLYLKEDTAALSALMHDETQMTKDQQKVLLDNRNINWLTKMPAMMKDKPTLFAVGAGHLIGDQGVITLLREKGYTVKPIMN